MNDLQRLEAEIAYRNNLIRRLVETSAPKNLADTEWLRLKYEIMNVLGDELWPQTRS
jgi:hypothetical protein